MSELNGDETKSFTIKFATKVNSDIVAGEYKGDVVVSVVASPIVLQSLSISFDATQVEKVEIKMGSSTGTTIATITTNGGSTGELLEIGGTYYLVPTFRSGYEFSSWSKTGAVGTLGSATTANTSYTVGEGVNSLTLTAKTSSLQNMSSCPAGVTTVTDSRDGETYAIGTLADGKCWMLENLRLSGSRTLTSADSNVKSNRSWNPNNGTTTDYTKLYAYQPTGTAKIYSNGSWSNTASATDMGMLYNYAAATAGTITGDNNQAEASEDICPAGWRLPKSSDYSALYSAYSSNYTNFNNAFKTVLAGGFGSRLNDVGSYGYFWSSTAYDTASRYRLRVGTGNVNPTNNDGRYNGFSVRCVLKFASES